MVTARFAVVIIKAHYNRESVPPVVDPSGHTWNDGDHVHMLLEYPPTVQLSKLVNSLKAVISRRLWNEFLDLRAAYSKPVPWSRSYFVGSRGGAPLEVVKKYIQH